MNKKQEKLFMSITIGIISGTVAAWGVILGQYISDQPSIVIIISLVFSIMAIIFFYKNIKKI